MKKLFFGFLFVGFIPNLWADSITSGVVGLLKPSTNTVDSSRSYGSKLNENFQIIANTMTGILNGSLPIPGVTAIQPTLQSPATGIYNLRSDAGTRYGIANTTGVEVGQGLNITSFMSTSSILTNELSTRTLVGYNGGSALGGGNITAINVNGTGGSASQSGSTLTITANSGGAGSAAGPSLRTWDVVIGTPGSPNTDYNGTSLTTMTNQAYSDRGVSLGANGFISSNTVPLSIFVRPGIYDGSKSTCPYLVTWYTPNNSSGTILSVNDTSATIVTNYGIIDGFTFDGGSQPFVNALVSMKYNGEIRNTTFIGCQAMANYNFRAALIEVVDSSSTKIHHNWLKQYHGCAGKVFQGQCGAMRIYNSIDSEIYSNLFSSPSYIGSAYENAFVTYNSSNINFHDNTIEGMAGSAISVNTQCRNVRLTRNVIKIGDGSVSDHANYGVITLDSDGPGQGTSSSTIADNNQFIFISTGGGSGQPSVIFRSRSVPTPPWNGILITNNVVTSREKSNWGFYQQVGGTVFNTQLANNYVFNLSSFIARDDGIGTKFKGLGNTLNGIPIRDDFGVFEASVTAYSGFTSTTGFIGASSTFNYVNVSTIIATSSGTFNTLTASSFTVSGGTVCFGQNCMFFSTSALVGTDLVFHYFNGKAYFGGDAVGSGVGGGGTPPSVQSPSTGPYVLRSDAGTRYGIAAATGIEVGAGLQLTTYFSTADARMNGIGIVFATDTSKPSPSLQSPATGSYSLNFKGIAASTGIEVGVGLQLTTYFSTADARMNGIGIVFSSDTSQPSPSLQSPATGAYSLNSKGIAASTGIEVGAGLQLTTWMSTMTALKITRWYQFPASQLTPGGTDFAFLNSTHSLPVPSGSGEGLNPYYVKSFSEATTDYARGVLYIPPNIDVSSTVQFMAVVQPSSAAASTNVQIVFQSTGNVDGQVYNMTNSTGINVCAMPTVNGQWVTCKWEAPVQSGTGNLGWQPGMNVDFQIGRGHDTSILLASELRARLLLKTLVIGLPERFQ